MINNKAIEEMDFYKYSYEKGIFNKRVKFSTEISYNVEAHKRQWLKKYILKRLNLSTDFNNRITVSTHASRGIYINLGYMYQEGDKEELNSLTERIMQIENQEENLHARTVVGKYYMYFNIPTDNYLGPEGLYRIIDMIIEYIVNIDRRINAAPDVN